MPKTQNQNQEDSIEKLQNLLKLNVKLTSIDEILSLPPSNLKGISPEYAEILEQFFQIESIEDLAHKTMDARGFEILSKNNISKSDWENWKSAAGIICEGLPDLTRQPVKKVIVIGLDNAGKSSVINILQRELGLDTLLNIKPTIGIFREQVELQSLKMTLWDLSGQKQYREQYTVEEKNLIFEEVDIILFVVDIQEASRFQEVFDYLNNIIQVLKKYKEQPAVIILLHKADPDFIDTPTFRENYIGLRSVFDLQLEKANLKHDYYITSIYNALPKAQGFRESVKSTVSQLKDMSHSSIPSNVLNGMTNIFDLVVKLSSILEDRMNQLEVQYTNLESYIQSEFVTGVRSIENIEARLEPPESKAKDVLVDELQKLITKKKRKPARPRAKKIAT